jgi:hypothetical protein
LERSSISQQQTPPQRPRNFGEESRWWLE